MIRPVFTESWLLPQKEIERCAGRANRGTVDEKGVKKKKIKEMLILSKEQGNTDNKKKILNP